MKTCCISITPGPNDCRNCSVCLSLPGVVDPGGNSRQCCIALDLLVNRLDFLIDNPTNPPGVLTIVVTFTVTGGGKTVSMCRSYSATPSQCEGSTVWSAAVTGQEIYQTLCFCTDLSHICVALTALEICDPNNPPPDSQHPDRPAWRLVNCNYAGSTVTYFSNNGSIVCDECRQEAFCNTGCGNPSCLTYCRCSSTLNPVDCL